MMTVRLMNSVGSRARRRRGAVGLTLAISLTVFGCANSRTDSASDARIWRAQLQRQQEVVRDQGRIGYIGYEGPSSR
jgi:hypothetical protein